MVEGCDLVGRAPVSDPAVDISPAQQTALTAFEAGRDALRAGRLAEAEAWFGRAHRLAPEDLSIGLMLGVTLLRRDRPVPAAAMLQKIAEAGGGREAWIALASARFSAGEVAAAAVALQHALARFRLPDDLGFAEIADKIAMATGHPGWCGLRLDGGIELRLAEPSARVEIALDGAKLRRAVRLRINGAPKLATTGDTLRVTVGGKDVLGSPLMLRDLRRCEGAVAGNGGGLAGWVWHPGDPDCDPTMTICDATGRTIFTVRADRPDMQAGQSLHRRRRLIVPAADLADLPMPIRVLGPDRRDLPGSPLDPLAPARAAAAICAVVAAAWPLYGAAKPDPLPSRAGIPADIMGGPAIAPLVPDRRVVVVVPVHGGSAVSRACLDAVFATVPDQTEIVVVDDASPEPDLIAYLDGLQRQRRIRLVRHASNRGFPAAANAGLRAAAKLAGARDAILLNSDTLVTEGWLEGLRAAVQAAPDIGSATPFSNDGSILSYPIANPAVANPVPTGAALARLARQVATANPGLSIDIPTGVGFCLYLRHECLRAVGVLREDLFAQGYGEENDFCLRARHLGWRHVGAVGVYVAHVGGQSFGPAAKALIARNLAVLEALHPGYHALIAGFERADPLAPARRRLDMLRWRDMRMRGPARRAVLLITHDHGGGVERVIAERGASLRADTIRPIVLRPGRDGNGQLVPDLCVVSDEAALTPNLRFTLPAELPLLRDLLKGDGIMAMEVHHLLGHNHAVLRLAASLDIPTDFHLHDYAMYCPRITLFGPDRRYCGEPADTRICDACVADAGRVIEEDIAALSLRARSANQLAAARRIIAPSADAATRIGRLFAGTRPVVELLEDDHRLPEVSVPTQGQRRRVCVVGAIGPEKGYDLLLGCARDAAVRNLPLEFALVGHSMDDQRLLDTGRVFVTGRYDEAEAVALIAAQAAQIGWLPSIWPETWCFALSLAWQAGLPVAVFDIGAQAERVRNHGQGWVLPLGLSPASINNAFITLERPVN